MKFFATVLSILFVSNLFSQKEVYIPNYIRDTNTVEGNQFTWSKTAQSENFFLIWGEGVGEDPTQASNPDLRFNPQSILDTMEFIYTVFEEFGFVIDTPGTNLSVYKVPIVMLNTYGPGVAEGWAFGGDVDGVIGAFWAHPLAMQTGHVAAHEFAHSMQAQAVIDYRWPNGFGPVWNFSGIFWETHANFLRNLMYPQDVTAWGMDQYHIETWIDWKNTYENYALLMAITESEGIDITNRLWRESFSNEYPQQAYKRLMNYDQSSFNDKMYEHIRRMATYDFNYNNLGNYFRQYRRNDLMYSLPSMQTTYTILDQDEFEPTIFRSPIHLSPEEYAYNVIPIHPDEDSCAVFVKFKGHNEVNDHAGWRYGFVTANPDGAISRYSETFGTDSSDIDFALESGESAMYFVVMGAPHDDIQISPDNDTWKGYPKHFRYPYEINIRGGYPEGFQDSEDFRSNLRNDGHIHENGGGWIQNSAFVDASVYVSPTAYVLGSSIITGNVRIENTSVVVDAVISDDAIIRDNAFVNRGWIRDQAIIEDQALLEQDSIWGNAKVGGRARVTDYKLHGDIVVGGDVIVYNNEGDCDNGVYLRMTNYYENNLLECDGRTHDHPANADVNQVLNSFDPSQLISRCNCANYPGCFTVNTHENYKEISHFNISPNPASGVIYIHNLSGEETWDLCIVDMMVNKLGEIENLKNVTRIDVTHLPAGVYNAVFTSSKKSRVTQRFIVQ